MGESLLPQTAHVIIMEFKKFMYMQAVEIQKKTREGTLDLTKNFKKDKQWFFSAPFTAPTYLDRVWRLLILYNKNYEEFCQKACGGFIERDDPRENYQISFANYHAALVNLDQRKDIVKPFNNLWPRYNDVNEFMTDYEFNCYVSGEGIPQIIGYMNQHCVESGSQQIQVDTCKSLAAQCRKEFTISGAPLDVKISVVQGNSVKHKFFKGRAQTPAQVLNKALSLVFPARFLDNLMMEQLLDANTANKWLLEYRKYLVLAHLTDNMISPSEQVDQVWHLHMTYTQHYKATYQTLIERDFKHSPSSGGSSEGKKFEKIYEDTLDFYKQVFMTDAPPDVWETTQQRFEMKNFEFRNINLYRLAVLYSMKVNNPQFLFRTPPTVPTAPPPTSGARMKALPIQQKKMILRRNKRDKYKNQNQKYGWRNQYHGDTYYVYHDVSYSSRSNRDYRRDDRQ
mmetsp:Transcript_10629/g.12098  ORF Transcript_10629/g.12098 Transcript_10629/m.12098 type:complete len:453 (-) Transcript_10629:480-1838(-)